ncbi:MAG: hypothetical protein R3C25_11420 [Hyphomonadaceae bacterium]
MAMRAWSSLVAVLLSACATPHAATYATLTDPSGCVLERIAVEADISQFQFDGLSPDGRLLAVGWERGEGASRERGAYILDLQSGAREPLPAFNNAASFSPDGRALIGAVFTADRRTEIQEQDRAGGSPRILASDPAADFLPSFSPDMQRIVFNSYRSGASDIYALDVATGSLARLTSFEGYEAYAQLSPDGSKLLFHRNVAGADYDIVLLDLVANEERVIIGGPGEESYPTWSPDGRHILFSSDRASGGGANDLYVADAQGGDVRRLTSAAGNDSYSTWAPNGEDIYFVSHRQGQHGIYRLHLDDQLRCRP